MYIIISQTFFLSLVATFISRGSFFVCMSGLTLAIEFHYVLSRLCCCLYWIYSYGNGVDFWNTLWPIIYKCNKINFVEKRWHDKRKKSLATVWTISISFLYSLHLVHKLNTLKTKYQNFEELWGSIENCHSLIIF